MNVLIGYENSGIVRDTFIARGHHAISCDLLPSDRPGPHIQGYVEPVLLESQRHQWDLIILHPECTKVCVSGNHVYAKGKPKYDERLQAAYHIALVWRVATTICGRVCLENPVGVLHTLTDMPKPHFIQPHDFGHDASKKTGLTLHGLIPLKPTKRIQGRMVNGVERWDNQCDSGQNKLGPSDDRWKLRSETYQGVADAFADQWGDN